MQQEDDDRESTHSRKREADRELQTLETQIKDAEGQLAIQVPASKAKAEEARCLAAEQVFPSTAPPHTPHTHPTHNTPLSTHPTPHTPHPTQHTTHNTQHTTHTGNAHGNLGRAIKIAFTKYGDEELTITGFRKVLETLAARNGGGGEAAGGGGGQSLVTWV